jgi:hypothetical protein
VTVVPGATGAEQEGDTKLDHEDQIPEETLQLKLPAGRDAGNDQLQAPPVAHPASAAVIVRVK